MRYILLVLACLTLAGCQWRVSDHANSGRVIDFRCPAPCEKPATPNAPEGR